MSQLERRRAVLRGKRDYWQGARDALQLVTLATMASIAFVVLASGQTLYTAHGYAWFIAHWPFTDRAWGVVFGICAAIGSLSLLRRGRYLRLFSAFILGWGHATIAYGVWTVNPIAMSVPTYGTLAVAAFLVIFLGILADW
jgi:hypothetical protein